MSVKFRGHGNRDQGIVQKLQSLGRRVVGFNRTAVSFKRSVAGFNRTAFSFNRSVTQSIHSFLTALAAVPTGLLPPHPLPRAPSHQAQQPNRGRAGFGDDQVCRNRTGDQSPASRVSVRPRRGGMLPLRLAPRALTEGVELVRGL